MSQSKPPAGESGLDKTPRAVLVERLRADYLGRGQVAYADGDRSTHDPAAFAAGAHAVVELYRADPALAARLDAALVTPEFVAVGEWLAHALDETLAGEPPDLRRFVRGPSIEPSAAARAIAALDRLRQSAADAARGLRRRKDAERLSHPFDLDPEDPQAILDAMEPFVASQSALAPILAEAGIGEPRRGELRELQPLLARQAGASPMAARPPARDAIKAAVQTLLLALECYFATYRARVRTAVGDDPEALARSLEMIPRQRDRRRA